MIISSFDDKTPTIQRWPENPKVYQSAGEPVHIERKSRSSHVPVKVSVHHKPGLCDRR